jgi:hypothetical protein
VHPETAICLNFYHAQNKTKPLPYSFAMVFNTEIYKKACIDFTNYHELVGASLLLVSAAITESFVKKTSTFTLLDVKRG